jgi:hypothetical protein
MASKINDSMEWLHIKEVKRLVLIGKLKLTKKQKKEIDDSIKKLEEAEKKKKKEEEDKMKISKFRTRFNDQVAVVLRIEVLFNCFYFIQFHFSHPIQDQEIH